MSKSIWFQPLSIDDFKDSSVNMDKHLDIEIVEIGDDFIVGRMPVIEKTKQPYGILHGGASCVLAESIGSTAAALSMDSTRLFSFFNHRHSANNKIITNFYNFYIKMFIHVDREVFEIINRERLKPDRF